MLVGIQFGVTKLLTTTGPLGFPIRGSITSTVPTVRLVGLALPFVTRNMWLLGLKAEPPNPAKDTTPVQLGSGVAWSWSQNAPLLALIMGPWWQGTFTPPVPMPTPDTPD